MIDFIISAKFATGAALFMENTTLEITILIFILGYIFGAFSVWGHMKANERLINKRN